MIKPRKEIVELKSYQTALYPQTWDMKLDSNENYIGPSSSVIKALKQLSTEDVSHYPHYGNLYKVLSEKYDIDKSCIAITNGADEALYAVINTYIENNDCVLSVEPSFSMPELYSKLVGANYIKVPYKKKWSYPLEEIINAVDIRTKMIIITSPNNPTGDIISQEEIIKILEIYPDIAIVVDETYANFSQHTCISLCDTYKNLIVVRSFSKDYGLAGLRLGCVISAAENIDCIKKTLSPYNVNSIAVIAAIEALKDDNYIETVRTEYKKSYEFLFKNFKELNFTTYQSYGNFILVDFGSKCNLIYEKLKSNKIIVKNFDSTDKNLSNCLRITLPTYSAATKILDLIKSRDTVVFDMDGVLVDVSSSYMQAIKYTYNYFTGKEIDDDEIYEAKKLGGLNNDWDLTDYLIRQCGFDFSYDDIVEIFQKQYWNDGKGSINNESLLIDTKVLDELSKNYNLAIFTGRPKEEAYYTLNKFEILKYFSKIVTMNDLPHDRQKPKTDGLKLIKDSFLTDEIIYLGDTVDDMFCASDFGAYGIGVLKNNSDVKQPADYLFNAGAKVVINSVNDIINVLEI